jgi:hypothetical protein
VEKEIEELNDLLNKPKDKWEKWRKPDIMELVEHIDWVGFWYNKLANLKAQLSILTEYDKSIKEMIEGFKEDIAHILEVTSTEVYQEFANNEGVAKYIIKLKKDLHKNNNSKINELLSKIGDNSEVKE